MYESYHRSMEAKRVTSEVAVEDRLLFLQKVYSLMLSGIIVFALAAGLPIIGLLVDHEPSIALAGFFIGLPWFMHLILLIGGAFAAQIVSEIPVINVIAFYSFAILFGFLSIGLIFYAVNVGGPFILLQALVITSVAFLGLTAYVFITKQDFSFMRGFLMMGLFTLIGAVIVIGILHSSGVGVYYPSLAISMFAVVLFSLYVLYDTSEIMNRYRPEMWVTGALALFIDFVMMFLNILRLLAARD